MDVSSNTPDFDNVHKKGSQNKDAEENSDLGDSSVDPKKDRHGQFKTENREVKTESINDEKRGYQTESETEKELTENVTSGDTADKEGTSTSQTRFSSSNEQPIGSDGDKTLENYFQDSYTDDFETEANLPPKQTTDPNANEITITNATADESTFDLNTDEYYNNREKPKDTDEQGQVTIVTKKRGEPPREMNMMTDEQKIQLKKSEESQSNDADNEEDVSREAEGTESPKSNNSDNNEDATGSKHRCPSPGDSSIDSEHHIYTKKKVSVTEPPVEPAKADKGLRDENKTTNRSAAGSSRGRTGPSQPKKRFDNKSDRTVNQRPTTSNRNQSPRALAAQAKQENPRMSKSAGPAGRQTISRAGSSVASTRSPSRWSRPRTCGYRPGE